MKYLYKKDGTVFAKCENCGRTLKFKEYEIEEVRTGVECFCGNMSNKIIDLPQDKKVSIQPVNAAQNSVGGTRPAQPQPSGPRCPTCGSTKVSKISLSSKVVGGAMVGLYSSNVRNTFKCDNCGYKW